MKLHGFHAIIENNDELINFLIRCQVFRDEVICCECGSIIILNQSPLEIRFFYTEDKSIGKQKQLRV